MARVKWRQRKLMNANHWPWNMQCNIDSVLHQLQPLRSPIELLLEEVWSKCAYCSTFEVLLISVF